MDHPVNRSSRLDGIDAERFEDMVVSESFGLLRERIAAELERARTDCETQADVARAQGQVKAFRTVLDLPSMILKEMRKKSL